jgi:hypothetical protein
MAKHNLISVSAAIKDCEKNYACKSQSSETACSEKGNRKKIRWQEACRVGEQAVSPGETTDRAVRRDTPSEFEEGVARHTG